jgi:hypothetical protein
MNNSNSTNSDRSTITEILRSASADLLFLSESESPFEVFLWELPADAQIAPEMIIDRTGVPIDTLIEFTDLTSFFAVATTPQDWHGAAEIEMVNRYQNLVRVLQENLTDIQVVRVGEINIDVYIVGKTSDGNLAGLKTNVVET